MKHGRRRLRLKYRPGSTRHPRGEISANNRPGQVSGLAAISPAAFPANASGMMAGLQPHTVTGSRRPLTGFP